MLQPGCIAWFATRPSVLLGRSSSENAGNWNRPAGDRHGSSADLIDAATAADALESLPLEQREVVVARIWGGLSFIQIGQLVGVSDSAAHRRYEAGLSALRQKLRVSCQKNE